MGGGAFTHAGLAREAARLHIRALAIIHFFSGYRRAEDIHHIIDQRIAEDGTHVFALSIDLCMQRKSGGLATSAALKWWKARVLSGQVVAAGGGPPCETYTVARTAEEGLEIFNSYVKLPEGSR